MIGQGFLAAVTLTIGGLTAEYSSQAECKRAGEAISVLTGIDTFECTGREVDPQNQAGTDSTDLQSPNSSGLLRRPPPEPKRERGDV